MKGILLEKTDVVYFRVIYCLCLGMSKIIIIVRNKPRISLIKLVISIIPVISCKKGKSLLKSSLSEGHLFWRGGGGIATFRLCKHL